MKREAPPAEGLVLVVRRVVEAEPDRLFDAWTRPEELRAWWGPRSVRCTGAEVDLRAGGRYRIDHELPGGARLTIEGQFSVVERPRRLAYSWRVVPGGGGTELVTVRFEPKGVRRTEVIVTHERIGSADLRSSHEEGWAGCLDGLARHAAAPP